MCLKQKHKQLTETTGVIQFVLIFIFLLQNLLFCYFSLHAVEPKRAFFVVLLRFYTYSYIIIQILMIVTVIFNCFLLYYGCGLVTHLSFIEWRFNQPFMLCCFNKSRTSEGFKPSFFIPLIDYFSKRCYDLTIEDINIRLMAWNKP